MSGWMHNTRHSSPRKHVFVVWTAFLAALFLLCPLLPPSGALAAAGVTVTPQDTQSDEGGDMASFSVVLDQRPSDDVTIAVSSDDASEGVVSTTLLTFTPGNWNDAQTVTVTGVDDALDDGNVAYNVILENAVSTDLDYDGLDVPDVALTNLDNDPLPAVSIAPVLVSEGPGATAFFIVTLSQACESPVRLDYATSPASAVSPDDFTAVNGTLVFNIGALIQLIQVPVVDDALDEDSETFTVTLSNLVNATPGSLQASATILDNDNPPVLSVASTSVLETNSGVDTTAAFTLTLSTASGRSVSAQAATINGTAIQPDDYIPHTQVLDFMPGETSQSFLVTVKGDVLDEDTETFNVVLSGVSNASYLSTPITGTIEDNDDTPGISIADVTVTEGNSGTVTANFQITLSEPSGRRVTVEAETVNGSASAPADFTAKTQVVEFTPGDTDQTFAVTVQGDFRDETDETFSVHLSHPRNADITRANATGTISDDDTAGLLVTPSSGLETSENGQTALFSVTLSSQPENTITVAISSSDTSEGEIVTPTLTFSASDWNQPKNSAVRGVPDALEDGPIAYTVRLDPSGDPDYNNLPTTVISAVNRDRYTRLYLPVAMLEHVAALMPVFVDDFSSDKNWTVYASEQHEESLSGGAYWLRHYTANRNIRSVAPTPPLSVPYSVEVVAAPGAGSSPGTRFGVLFDWLDAVRFYRMVLDPSAGTWEVQKFAGSYQTILSGALPGGVTFPAAIKVERDSLNIRVYIQSALVGEVQDTTYQNGQAGVILIAPATLGAGAYAEASFDNFILTPLPYTYQTRFASPGLEQHWAVTASAGYQVSLESEALKLAHNTADRNVRAISPLAGRGSPYSVAVNARLAPGADAGVRYGLLFGWLDANRFYRFIVDPLSGQYFIQKWTGVYQPIASGSLPPGFSASGALLMIKRNGGNIEFYINRLKLGLVADATYLNGQAGVIMIAPAGLSPGASAAALFDDFTIGPLP